MMQEKTKKWWARLGAGMLLGLSIFNLGGFFHQSDQAVPRSAGNFRRKEDSNVNPEIRGMMKVVEEEAELAISQKGKTYRNLEKERFSPGQKILRYSLVSVWTISAGIFFSSLIFNAPFALGRLVLSALPGTVHSAFLELTSTEKVYLSGEKIKLDLNLKSLEGVSSAKVFVEFPREIFFLERKR